MFMKLVENATLCRTVVTSYSLGYSEKDHNIRKPVSGYRSVDKRPTTFSFVEASRNSQLSTCIFMISTLAQHTEKEFLDLPVYCTKCILRAEFFFSQ